MMYVGVLFPEVTVVKCEGLALVLSSVKVMTIRSVVQKCSNISSKVKAFTLQG